MPQNEKSCSVKENLSDILSRYFSFTFVVYGKKILPIMCSESIWFHQNLKINFIIILPTSIIAWYDQVPKFLLFFCHSVVWTWVERKGERESRKRASDLVFLHFSIELRPGKEGGGSWLAIAFPSLHLYPYILLLWYYRRLQVVSYYLLH